MGRVLIQIMARFKQTIERQYLMSTNCCSIRDYKEGDEFKIMQLFTAVFGGCYSLDKWRWQYRNNNIGQAWIAVAEAANEIVAHYALMRQNLNFMGRELIAVTPTDTMVRSNQRGQGWYTRLATRVYGQAHENGAKAVFGFPNRESLPGFLRNLGGHKIANLKTFYYRTGFRKHLGAAADCAARFFYALPNRAASSFMSRQSFPRHSIQISSTLPPDLGKPLKEMLDQEVLSVWKDYEYLEYRYQNHPDRTYRFHILYAGDQPAGLVVVRDASSIAMICEVMHRKKDVRETAFLPRSVLSHYQRHSESQHVEFRGWDSGFFDAVFSLSGFRCLPTSELVFAGRVFDDPDLEKKFLLPHNWTITIGDTDIV
jgi:hypothetical protein